MENKEIVMFIDKAVAGDKTAMEKVLENVQDLIFNLSLRMLGTISDAEDATQEIMLRIMTHLSTFRKESAFSTWVYRLATNYLINYKKSLFASGHLSFEYYGKDIDNGFLPQDPTVQAEESLLAEELKQSCTNVMLQCLDAESRVIYVLGVMFKVNSRICGEILEITPEAYRQKLTRVKTKLNAFMKEYCGLGGGKCDCGKRVTYAIKTGRLSKDRKEYSELKKLDANLRNEYISAMDELDELSLVFANLPMYKSTDKATDFIKSLISSKSIETIRKEL